MMLVPVTDAASLTNALANAHAGDEIVLAPGTYALTGASCSAAGTPAAPIVVRAATPLGARIDFNALEGFKVSGPNWHFEGLDIHGVCANDTDCEHAFHVTGAADGFVLRGSRVVDFNAQVKVNAAPVGPGGAYVVPNAGLVEYNELYDAHARNTSNPVTKVNIDTGDAWVVRGNYIHDFHRAGSAAATYGAFMKSGGTNGLFERNLVLCTKDEPTSGVYLGLSFGGGGTAPQFCAPAFDAAVPCAPEHTNGTMRNNVIVNCSDVGIYLNQAKTTKLHFNTLIATTGIDFRFAQSSGEARGNVVSGPIRTRDQAQAPALAENLVDVTQAQFDAFYVAPLAGDLRKKGDLSTLIGKGTPIATMNDDYCARQRGTGAWDIGALEHSLGDCLTTRPPVGGGMTGDGGAPGGDGGGSGDGGAPALDGGGGASNDGGGAAPDGDASGEGGGCGCRLAAGQRGASAGGGASAGARTGARAGGTEVTLVGLALAAAALLSRRRRRRVGRVAARERSGQKRSPHVSRERTLQRHPFFFSSFSSAYTHLDCLPPSAQSAFVRHASPGRWQK